jgi:hypothetical protein
MSGVPRRLCRIVATGVFVPGLLLAGTGVTLAGQRFDGFNVIAVPGHQFGSATARRALATAKRLGASAVAIVPFLWQAAPSDPAVGRGQDVPDSELRSGIRDARALGFSVLVKPHVWVPESWAGAIAMRSEEDWQSWFAGYRTALMGIAAIAAEENAQALAIGTELAKTSQRAEWFELIAATRGAFPGTLTYVAHNADEAERVPFWGSLDLVGVSLYPKLGADGDRTGRLVTMHAAAKRLDQVAARTGKRVLVGEIGLRSAEGAAAKPWESAEERSARADPLLQARVLADWLSVLRRPSVRGVLVWRWFTDPSAGGFADTDFTVQGKPAEGVLLCAWTAGCSR